MIWFVVVFSLDGIVEQMCDFVRRKIFSMVEKASVNILCIEFDIVLDDCNRRVVWRW